MNRIVDDNNSTTTENPQESAGELALWHLAVIAVIGAVLVAIPCFVYVPRGFARFVFGVGASSIASALLSLIFVELRRPPRPRFVFRSRFRLVASLLLLIASFVAIFVLTLIARAGGAERDCRGAFQQVELLALNWQNRWQFTRPSLL